MIGKKLLVADDSLTIQKVIRLALSNEGYEIKAVSDGNEAIQEIAVFQPNVVLIDVSLPGKTAFEVKRAIQDSPDLVETRFILMSSAFEKVDEAQYSELSFHGRFTKPFDPAHLRKVLSDVLNQVIAKRMEPTNLIQQPSTDSLSKDGPPPLPSLPGLPPFSLNTPSSVSATPPPPSEDLLEVPEQDLPIVQEPPPPPAIEEDLEPLWKAPSIEETDLQQWAVQDKKNRSILSPASPTPPPFSEPAGGSLKIAGEKTLNDLKSQIPSFPPGKGFADLGDSNFPLQQASKMPPLPSAPTSDGFSKPQAIEISGDDDDDLPMPVLMDDDEEEDSIQPIFSAPSTLQHKEVIAGKPISQNEANSGNRSAPDSAWVEQLVRKQVEESLSSLAQRLLPDIAERVIKEEIHKLLQQAP